MKPKNKLLRALRRFNPDVIKELGFEEKDEWMVDSRYNGNNFNIIKHIPN